MDRDTFVDKLKELKLNKKDFVEISHVPYSTVNAWGSTANKKILPIPPWVEPFLNYYEKALKLDYVTDEICAKIKEAKGN